MIATCSREIIKAQLPTIHLEGRKVEQRFTLSDAGRDSCILLVRAWRRRRSGFPGRTSEIYRLIRSACQRFIDLTKWLKKTIENLGRYST
jgi:hypothetical protein